MTIRNKIHFIENILYDAAIPMPFLEHVRVELYKSTPPAPDTPDNRIRVKHWEETKKRIEGGYE